MRTLHSLHIWLFIAFTGLVGGAPPALADTPPAASAPSASDEPAPSPLLPKRAEVTPTPEPVRVRVRGDLPAYLYEHLLGDDGVYYYFYKAAVKQIEHAVGEYQRPLKAGNACSKVLRLADLALERVAGNGVTRDS